MVGGKNVQKRFNGQAMGGGFEINPAGGQKWAAAQMECTGDA